MKLEKGFLYHLYNRGNNGERIFYNSSNYQYFITKVNYHLAPYADILSWCLMPNHFHLMIYVFQEDIFSLSINKSIGRMLSSYARAINLQESRSGSLFQQHSKAVCLNDNSKLKPAWFRVFGATKMNNWNDMQSYPRVCMDYIHLNPVKAGIVTHPGDWKWSSYNEIHVDGAEKVLVNMERIKNVLPL